MTEPGTTRSGHLGLLFELGWQRIGGLLRSPTPKLVLGVGLPAAVLCSALVVLGRAGVPNPSGAAGGLTLGLLVSATLSFLSYGVLFGGSDNLFLRQLGVAGRELYLERGLRLCFAGAVTVVAVLIPFAAAGDPLGPPLVIGLTAAAVCLGTANLAYAWAARSTAGGGSNRLLSAGIRQWDPGLARAAPLVYAPLLPFLAGSFAGAVVGGAQQLTGLLVLASVVVAVAGTRLGAALFAPASARFLPTATEMSYAPPPEGGGEEFRQRRGLASLLPRPAAAVWVRDATVGSRRFGWAARVTWPVVIVSIVALARWGESSAAHAWVVAAVGLALVIQAAAVVGLGIVERHGPRWIDRSMGIAWRHRFAGRWAWSWGLSLWLLVPVALAWWWWSGFGTAWAWPVAGAFSAGVATMASLLNSERR
ncbi:MAG: hypothetical protein GEU90_07310 [Gemmatimonas sp.]|nr:hypothetical protein [Gemmatimonas sp.]